MSKVFILMLTALLCLSMIVPTAEAKRFGSGGSMGRHYSVPNKSSMNQRPQSATNSTAPRNSWLGPLAGFALGGLLASMFMGHGFGGGLIWIVLLAVGGFMLFRYFQRNRPNVANPFKAAAFNNGQQAPLYNANEFEARSGGSYSVNNGYPAGFEANAFVRDAKVLFIRMQAANDAKNLQDIREFSTPELFANICLQIQERGNEENVTEVTSLDAELLQAFTEQDRTIASVRFSGIIREEVNGPTLPFNEIWHMQKEGHSVWRVAGIQQEIEHQPIH